MKSPNKDITALMRDARKAGWTVDMTGGNHLRWSYPNGALFYSSLTPSDRRVIRKIRIQIRKAEGGVLRPQKLSRDAQEMRV